MMVNNDDDCHDYDDYDHDKQERIVEAQVTSSVTSSVTRGCNWAASHVLNGD